MNIAEKSMEKTRFYNREDLKAKDVARLISIWEGEAGESFTDYCNFSREADKNFLLFLAEKYPILYDYHCKVAGNDWLDHCIQYVVDHCGEYLTQWVPAEEYRLSWQLEGLNTNQIQELLFQEKGINWNDYPTKFRRGSCCIKKYHQTMNQTLRGYWYIDDEIPIFTGEGRDYIEKLI